ncbi:MAG: DNA polymerase III subunit beta [Bdellovibrionales bacterium]|nr:DNA polymerase III subunit beta [Bdellovibrionales bacterium]
MNIVVTKENLAKALSLTQSVVERKTTMPILANILLTVREKGLQLAATDLEITALTSIDARVQSTGSTTVNARVFSDIVRELPDGEVSLSLSEGERLEILAGKSKFRMIGVSADEFPSLPGITIEVSHRVPGKQFLEMIQKTLYAVSHDETRFNLNGVCFEALSEGKGKSTKKMVRMVATDGHRLSMITRPFGELSFDGRAIVPAKGLSELRKLLDDDDSEVGVALSDGFFVIESARGKIATRLIDGEFPDYNQVLPKKAGEIVSVPSGDFAQALRRAALMVTDKGKCVKLDFGKDRLRISSSSPELGESSEELAVGFKGDQTTVGFNARYLLEFCSSIEEEQPLLLELSGELGPARLKVEGDDSYFGVVMPMRLN